MKNFEDKDEERENRIQDEVIVDAYGEIERALGWYYYLEDRIIFPFRAKCIKEFSISPLEKGEIIQVVGMLPEDDCETRMFVKIDWNKRTLGVPLEQLEPIEVDEDTLEAIEDWHYWLTQGHQF